MALVISAVMTAPWPSASSLATGLIVLGAAGLLYSPRVLFHALKASYRAEFEDWVWYITAPVLNHALVAVAGVLVFIHSGLGLLMIAVAAMLFLLVGIRNAWDSVT